jgi:hypothetical protein
VTAIASLPSGSDGSIPHQTEDVVRRFAAGWSSARKRAQNVLGFDNHRIRA